MFKFIFINFAKLYNYNYFGYFYIISNNKLK